MQNMIIIRHLSYKGIKTANFILPKAQFNKYSFNCHIGNSVIHFDIILGNRFAVWLGFVLLIL